MIFTYCVGIAGILAIPTFGADGVGTTLYLAEREENIVMLVAEVTQVYITALT